MEADLTYACLGKLQFGPGRRDFICSTIHVFNYHDLLTCKLLTVGSFQVSRPGNILLAHVQHHENTMETRKAPVRKDGRIIIHFVRLALHLSIVDSHADMTAQDHDRFYAAVFEARNPSLKSQPFAVQQKHIIATCNYEARKRGLYKLMLVRDARRMCPEVIIELGEDLTMFRNASKELYNFIKDFSWNGKLERLGFDEVR